MADIKNRLEALESAALLSTGGSEALAEWRDFQTDFEENEPDAVDLIRQAGAALGKRSLRAILKMHPKDPELGLLVGNLRKRVAMFCNRHSIKPAHEVHVILFHRVGDQDENQLIYSTGSDEVARFTMLFECPMRETTAPVPAEVSQ